MLHPRLTSVNGAQSAWLAQIGPYGSWSDLQVITRWGNQGAAGMFEASWKMPLPPGFDHRLLRRGTRVDIFDGAWPLGSSLLLSEPARGAGLGDPWQLIATGVGREAEGSEAFYAFDSGGNSTNVLTTAVDQAISRGLPWAGRDATISATPFGTTDGVQTVGAFLSAAGDYLSQRWRVSRDNLVGFRSDPPAYAYQVVPGAAALGVADDGYASTILARYLDSATSTYKTVSAIDLASGATNGRRELLVDLTGDEYGAITTAVAQQVANGVLAKLRGRLGWTNRLTLTSNEILTAGGQPANLSKVAEDVGEGCMVRLHGIWDGLLEYNGQTWLDVIIGEARYTDGTQAIDLAPLGLAARDLASVTEAVTRKISV